MAAVIVAMATAIVGAACSLWFTASLLTFPASF